MNNDAPGCWTLGRYWVLCWFICRTLIFIIWTFDVWKRNSCVKICSIFCWPLIWKSVLACFDWICIICMYEHAYHKNKMMNLAFWYQSVVFVTIYIIWSTKPFLRTTTYNVYGWTGIVKYSFFFKYINFLELKSYHLNKWLIKRKLMLLYWNYLTRSEYNNFFAFFYTIRGNSFRLWN